MEKELVSKCVTEIIEIFRKYGLNFAEIKVVIGETEVALDYLLEKAKI